MTLEFVYVTVKFYALLLTKGSSSSVLALDLELASRPEVTTFSTNCKDTFRMIV